MGVEPDQVRSSVMRRSNYTLCPICRPRPYNHLLPLHCCLITYTPPFLFSRKVTCLRSIIDQISCSPFFLSLHSTPLLFFFFFKDTAPTEIYPLSLHDAFPI